MKRQQRGGRAAADFVSSEYFALRTFRSDGSAVSVPIWLAPDGDHLYAYTPARSWKVRRIARDSRIEVAASDFLGTPHGVWRVGRARVLERGETRMARRALATKYGLRFRYFTVVLLIARPRRHGGRAVGLQITLAASPDR